MDVRNERSIRELTRTRDEIGKSYRRRINLLFDALITEQLVVGPWPDSISVVLSNLNTSGLSFDDVIDRPLVCAHLAEIATTMFFLALEQEPAEESPSSGSDDEHQTRSWFG